MCYDIKQKIIEFIKNKKLKSIGIVMHNNPDGDCIGSAVALQKALEYNNKKVDIIFHNKVSNKFSKIVGKNKVEKIIVPYEDKRYDAIFMLDVSDFNRTYIDVKRKTNNIIIIDHHEFENIPKVKFYLNKKEASTGIIVYDLIKNICPLTPEIATCIYLTIKSDTSGFKNSNVDYKAHKITSELLKYGADIKLINSIYDDITISYIRLLSIVLQNLKIDNINKIAYLIISKNDIIASGSNLKEAGLIIDLLKSINDIDVCYVIIENNKQVIIKGRSKKTDISCILKEFGGGGHKNSASCITYSDDIYKTKDRLIYYTIEKINK